MNNGNRPRVVITGMGVVSVLGDTLEDYWNNLLAGKSGISKITTDDVSYAQELGYAIKHLGITRKKDNGIDVPKILMIDRELGMGKYANGIPFLRLQ